jgi:hypothetical protein
VDSGSYTEIIVDIDTCFCFGVGIGFGFGIGFGIGFGFGCHFCLRLLPFALKYSL